MPPHTKSGEYDPSDGRFEAIERRCDDLSARIARGVEERAADRVLLEGLRKDVQHAGGAIDRLVTQGDQAMTKLGEALRIMAEAYARPTPAAGIGQKIGDAFIFWAVPVVIITLIGSAVSTGAIQIRSAPQSAAPAGAHP